MGQLDMLKGFKPENITPQGAFSNPLGLYQWRTADIYPNPENFSMAGIPGPFTPAGVSEVTRSEFLQDKWHWPRANGQMVTVPERPIDQGTYNAILGNAGQSGVYLQNNVIGSSKSTSGSAPTTGIYTGYFSRAGEFEGETSCNEK
jgi:hypothetical protein